MIDFHKWKAEITNNKTNQGICIEFYTNGEETPRDRLEKVFGKGAFEITDIFEIEDNE